MNRRSFVATYVLGFVGANGVLVISSIADLFHGALRDGIRTGFGILILMIVVYLLITWVNATINRLQDIGWHWALILLFGFIPPALIILALIPGQKEHNKYGPSPAPAFDLKNAFRWW